MKPATELRADIRKAAQSKGLITQEAIADALGITPTYFCDILKERKRLTPDLVRRASTVLVVSRAKALYWQRLGARESGWQIDLPGRPA